ncbi:MAG TPA: tetratricopeptide repeat protein [Chthoniobacterales bacterium]|jgi:TolB-like protein|nr:tetratricopeptide repeat protein [Chthoniobacterales bacterium]
MSGELKPGVQLEIGHVLFMDVVGYSKLSIDQQRLLQERLNEIVRSTECFRSAEANGRLVRLPVGDGMALVFLDSPEAPLRCAMEIQRALKGQPDIQLRMGINSGPINQVRDVNDRTNIAGAGINMAQRVMDCADAGHILLSKRTAEDLAQSDRWQPHLHDLGQCEVKHQVKIDIFNYYDGEIGNAQTPQKLSGRAAAKPWRRKWWIAAVAILTVFLALLIYQKRFASRAVHDKSIAVLPFVNMSADPQNAFFADGIQDDILTSLSRIKDLRVISRTSVMGFRGGKEAHNLREIGRTLGVSNVLEGSVRREGNRVVVTVQLLDAAKDRHLWANRYDRTLADSLGLQGELAAQIADELRVTLSADEKTRVETKPTENADAYLVYLQANQVERNPDTLLADYKKAEELYLKAIGLDPKFALAHARLASTLAEIFHYYEPTDAWKTKARSEADIALQLQPNLGEAHLALGQCVYWFDHDYDRALNEFETALRLAPNNSEGGVFIAAIKRRQGKWQEALQRLERIGKLDPQNPNVIRTLLFTATALRQWPEAAELVARMRALAPASLVAKAQSGYVDFWWKGETQSLKSFIAQIPAGVDPDGVVTTCRWDVAMIERDFNNAKRVLDESPLTEFSYTNAGMTPKNFFYGCVALAQGDANAARNFFESTRASYEAGVNESPDSADRHANLGLTYAFLGRKQDAIREGRRAVELKPESVDALDGALMSCYLALIYTRCDEKDLAIPLLERLLKTPGAVDSADYSVTVNDLKFRWEWDPLRNDPRFQKLLGTNP